MNSNYHKIFGVVGILAIFLCLSYVVHDSLFVESDEYETPINLSVEQNIAEKSASISNPLGTTVQINSDNQRVAVPNPARWNLQRGLSRDYFVQEGKVIFCFMCFESGGVPVEIAGADPESFVELFANQGQTYAKDRNFVYSGADRIIPEADSETFMPTTYMLKNGFPRFFIDKQHMFVAREEDGVEIYEMVPNADPATLHIFETIGPTDTVHVYAKDKNQFYCEGAPVSHIDPATVNVVETAEGDIVIKDKYGEYQSYFSSGELRGGLRCPKIQ